MDERFRACTEAYGAERRRWPAADWPLFDVLAPTPEGARLLAQAELTDRVLDAWDAAPPHDVLAQRIAAKPGAEVTPARRGIWLWVCGSVLSMAFGFAIGFVQVGDDGAIEMAGQFFADPAGPQDIGL